jgi:uncharacterized tellurite resistance protein B-like protein
MLDTLKMFFGELAGGAKHNRFEENDYRLAAAALLIHACAVDGNVAPVEREKLRTILKYRFALDDAATDELIAAATVMEGEAVDLYHFTSLINRSLDEEGRCRIIEMMWEIAYADGKLDEFEDNLVWRVADLIGVSSSERIALRQQVAGEQGGPAAAAPRQSN